MRRPIRAVGIVIKNEKILLMWRKNNGKEYYTFPGGGVEDNESVEDAMYRELREETSTTVKIEKLLYAHHLIGNSDQYFYLCSYLSGEPKLRESSEEKMEMEKGHNLYKPLFVDITEIDRLLLYPLEIRDWLIEDHENGFNHVFREISLHRRDLRQDP